MNSKHDININIWHDHLLRFKTAQILLGVLSCSFKRKYAGRFFSHLCRTCNSYFVDFAWLASVFADYSRQPERCFNLKSDEFSQPGTVCFPLMAGAWS